MARKVLDRWNTLLPPRQAPACPAELLFAMVVLLQAWGQQEVACSSLLCFCGLLRVSEALRLTPRHVVLTGSYCVLLLGDTKRGVEDRVVLHHPSVIGWLRNYCHWRQACNDDKLFGISYPRFQRWLRRAAAALGFADLELSTQSLRRGGATQLLRAGVQFQDIALCGRWRSDRSVKEYLRQGEVALTRASATHSAGDWERLAAVGRLHRIAWRDTTV